MSIPAHDVCEKLSPESEQAFRECFIEDPATGRIRFTAKGRAAYRSQFGRAGIDISPYGQNIRRLGLSPVRVVKKLNLVDLADQ